MMHPPPTPLSPLGFLASFAIRGRTSALMAGKLSPRGQDLHQMSPRQDHNVTFVLSRVPPEVVGAYMKGIQNFVGRVKGKQVSAAQ